MNYLILPPKPALSQIQNYIEMDPNLIREAVSRFAGWLLSKKAQKESTIGLYCKMITKILKEHNTIYLTEKMMENHIIAMQMDKHSSNYRRNVMICLELYSEFCGVTVKFGRPKRDRPMVKETLTEGEISVLISACGNVRERAILSIMAYSGARNQEICNLKVEDIDYGNNTVRIIEGKGTKSRVVCISGECVKVLLEYLAKYPREPNEYLFTTVRKNHQYTTYSMRKLVKRITARTPIKKRVYPHLFRHSLACNMLFRGANLLTIKEQLGHSFIETTMIYIRSRADRVAAEYRMYTPSYI